jgi:hypothetical protein
MSDELSPRARAFLRSVEHADDPSRADYDRVRAGVKEHLAASIAAGVAVLVTAKTAAASKATAVTAAATTAAVTAGASAPPAAIVAGGAGTALVTKIAVAVVLLGAVAGGTTAVVRHERAMDAAAPAATVAFTAARPAGVNVPQPKLPAPALPPTGVSEPPIAAAPAATAIAIAPATATAIAPVAATATATATATAIATPTTIATEAPLPAVSPLDAEIALLRDARAALRGGDPGRALALLDEHDHLYPAGALAEDASAQRIYVLCALGRTGEAHPLAGRFLAAHPASPHAASVRASCGNF